MPIFCPRKHLAGLEVADDPPRDGPGNLPHDQAAMRRHFLFQTDPRILVPQRALRVQCVEELAGRVTQGDHARLGRGTIQVYVEYREEDADPHGRTADEVVVRQLSDLNHLAIRGATNTPRSVGTLRNGSRKKYTIRHKSAAGAAARYQ